MNNALASRSIVRTRPHYPMLHELYTQPGSDTTALVPAVKRLMGELADTVVTASDLIDPE